MRRRAIAAATLATSVALFARGVVRTHRRGWLRGKVVVVTGGTRGLGLALARRFLVEGARVAVCARDESEVRVAQQLLPGALCLACDLTAPGAAADLVDKVVARYGGVDVLVNNAGIIQVGAADDMTREDYEAAMNIHFFAALDAVRAVLPVMRRRGGGRIVNIASLGGKLAVPHMLPYTASKFALVGLSEGLRAELAREGIAVTTVCPGPMRTGSPRNATFKGKHRDEYAWFAVTAAAPGLSIAADRAAARIVRACRNGASEVFVSLPARLVAELHGIFPGLSGDVAALVNRALPHAAGSDAHRGKDSASRPSILTERNERAAARQNQP